MSAAEKPLTPERKAEIRAIVENCVGRFRMPRPKVVTRNDVGTIRDADVHVSRADPNAKASGQDKVVEVRRPDYVTVNIPEWERQQEEKRAEREYQRSLDPYNYGHFGPTYDEE
jgi:hypothetical protein